MCCVFSFVGGEGYYAAIIIANICRRFLFFLLLGLLQTVCLVFDRVSQLCCRDLHTITWVLHAPMYTVHSFKIPVQHIVSMIPTKMGHAVDDPSHHLYSPPVRPRHLCSPSLRKKKTAPSFIFPTSPHPRPSVVLQKKSFLQGFQCLPILVPRARPDIPRKCAPDTLILTCRQCRRIKHYPEY